MQEQRRQKLPKTPDVKELMMDEDEFQTQQSLAREQVWA